MLESLWNLISLMMWGHQMLMKGKVQCFLLDEKPHYCHEVGDNSNWCLTLNEIERVALQKEFLSFFHGEEERSMMREKAVKRG